MFIHIYAALHVHIICVFGEPFKVEPEVPEHSAITRRQQFKVKSTLKEQKGKGKGQKQNKKEG